MHGLVFELKERMNSRQDQPVMFTRSVEHSTQQVNINLEEKEERRKNITEKKEAYAFACICLLLFMCV